MAVTTEAARIPRLWTSAASTVLAFNDLGMHCMDREFSVFSILPPFNVVHSQVVLRDADGKPYLADDIDVEVFYDAVADPSGSRNSYSAGVAKTDFWLHANSLFGVNLTAGQGLTGLYMPDDDPLNRGAQPMDYSASARVVFGRRHPDHPGGRQSNHQHLPSFTNRRSR